LGFFHLLAIILGLTALFGYINVRFVHLQDSIGLMLMGLLFTVILTTLGHYIGHHIVLQEYEFVKAMELNKTLLEGVLCFMLFAAGTEVRYNYIKHYRWLILALAIAGTVCACFLIGTLIYVIFPVFGLSISLIAALAFGALISPTDPIATLAILGKAGLPKYLQTVMEGESLFNDGVGIVLFSVFFTMLASNVQIGVPEAFLMFLREVLGGILLGMIISVIMHFMLITTHHHSNGLIISLAGVTLGYALAETIAVSGPIAMVVTGLVIGNKTLPMIELKDRTLFYNFWDSINEILNSLLFVLLGLHLVIIHYETNLLPVAIAIIVCLASRFISVLIPVATLNMANAIKAKTLSFTSLLTWGGLRGGLSLAMALSLPQTEDKPTILLMAYGVVAFSVLIQGSTISKLYSPEKLQTLLKKKE